MSDRCTTQKRFNNLFIEFRKTILPKIEENWENLSTQEQESLSKVNEFFCGLHFIVGLADQADASLKVYEKIGYGADSNSSLNNGFPTSESGTTRFIRICCKAVQERGCEKSGKMIQFSTWLKEQY